MTKRKRAECYCCGFTTEVESYERGPAFGGGTDLLCTLCAGTMAGTVHQHGHKGYPDGLGATLKAICYVGNAILEEVRKGRRRG